jgi:hypothetical protein
MIRFFLLWSLCTVLAMAEPPSLVPTFHGAYFVGLTNPDVRRASEAKLDYAVRDTKGREIQFTSIADVDQTKDEVISSPDFSLWTRLQANCAALKKFEQGHPAPKSNFPSNLTKSLVADFPAAAVPPVSNDDLEMRGDQTMKHFEKALVVELCGGNEAKASTATDQWRYYVLARADFDGDGFEDLLIRVDWGSLEGSGSGSEAFVLAKPTADGPVKVIWRSAATKR